MTPEELFDNFSYLTDWEDKYRYLIEMGDNLPPFSDSDKTDAHRVEGCMSQVWLTYHHEGDKYYFNATSDAHIVRGLEAVLLVFVNGKTTSEIQSLDFDSIFQKLGLEEHLSPTRRNGFFAMIGRIKEIATSN